MIWPQKIEPKLLPNLWGFVLQAYKFIKTHLCYDDRKYQIHSYQHQRGWCAYCGRG